MKKERKLPSPHVFLILLALVVLACLLTYWVPAGQFERAEDPITGQKLVVSDSFHFVESNPIPIWNLPEKIFLAFTDGKTAMLITFILFVGASFEIIMETGSILAFFERVLIRLAKKRMWVIPIFVTLFSVFGFTMGLSTAAVIFVPVGILAAKMLGFDTLTGTAMVTLGTNAGFAAGVFNPFSVGIAQTIAEVPLFSGAWIRWILLIALLVATTGYLMYYAKKYGSMEADSTEYGSDRKREDEKKELSFRQKAVLILFFACFFFIMYGVSAWKWEVMNIAVLLLVTGILCGLVYGYSPNQICDLLVSGSKKMMKGVIVIGLAATMRLVLSEGNIMDTIAYYATGFAFSFPNWAKLLGMFYGNALLDLVITSGSAHAAVAMPIMLPMADYLSLSRQSTVLAFQLGDGLVNLTSPISTTLTGVLAVSGLSYQKWIRFFAPLVGIYLVIGTLLIILAGAVGY